jgi:cytoskeletal protein CcmA (bactofilin family)
MGTAYTKTSPTNFVDGETINASDFTTEFDAIDATFETGGHQHDGTDGEGGAIEKLLSNTITFGTGADTDIAVTFNANTADGVLTWMEDEDYFKFSDDVLVNSDEKLYFRDTAIYLNSSADGQLDIVADTEIQIAATTIDINGNVDISGTVTIGSAEISEAELEILDGATATTAELNYNDTGAAVGTVVASKTVTADANKDVASFRNITLTGELDGGSLDISGDADIDGTTNLDAVDIDGNVQLDGTFTVGVDDTGYDVKLFGATASAYMLWDASADDLILGGDAGLVVPDGQFSLGSTAVTTTAAEINLIDGGTSRGTTAVASGDGILINDAGTMRMTNVDTVSTYFSSHNVGGSNIVTTGALNSGSITSGFGTIDTGSSAITTTGLISGGSLDIDDVLINGTTIGHTDDTDLITLADGVVTVAGELDAATLDISGNADIDGTTNLDAVDIDGAVQIDATVTVGANDQGYDIIFYGDTASANMTWDTSADDLIFNGGAGLIVPDGQFSLGSTAITSTGAELNILDGVTSTATELNLLDGSSAGSIVNNKAVIYSSGGVVNATDVAVSGSGNRSVSVTSTDGIASMEIGAAAGNSAFIDFKTPSSDDYDLRIGSQGAGSGGYIQIASGTLSLLTSGETAATFADDGAVTLYYDNTARLTTTSGGVQIDGTTTSDFLVIKTTEAGASSAPDVVLYRSSSSPADNDHLGKIEFRGRNDNSEDVQYAYISGQAVDVSDGTEDGRLYFITKQNGSDVTSVTIEPDGLILKGEGSNTTNATQGVAKSWAKITGSGTASLDDSLNVGSLTDNGTGDYTFTLSTNMGNVNACLTANSGQATTRSIVNCTTSTFDIDLFDSDGSTRGDSGRVFGALHGDLS